MTDRSARHLAGVLVLVVGTVALWKLEHFVPMMAVEVVLVVVLGTWLGKVPPLLAGAIVSVTTLLVFATRGRGPEVDHRRTVIHVAVAGTGVLLAMGTAAILRARQLARQG